MTGLIEIPSPELCKHPNSELLKKAKKQKSKINSPTKDAWLSDRDIQSPKNCIQFMNF